MPPADTALPASGIVPLLFRQTCSDFDPRFKFAALRCVLELGGRWHRANGTGPKRMHRCKRSAHADHHRPEELPMPLRPPAPPPVGLRRRRRSSIPSVVPLAVLLATSIAAASADSGRFTSEATSREISQSADGRFDLDGKLRASEVARSVDGRFALHSTNTPKVGCDAFPDPIFANGFEP